MAANLSWIGAATDGTNQMLNMNFQNWQNKKNRQFTEDMYWADAKQKVDRWNENNQYMEGMWNKQNAYNEKMWHEMQAYDTPAAQMQRYKDAGLNPNLIYGQSNVVGAMGTANFQGSGKAETGTISHPNYRAPQMGRTGFPDIGTIQAQTNNLEAQNALLKAQAANVQVDSLVKAKDADLKGIDLDLKQSLFGYQVDAAREGVRKTQNDIQMALSHNEREAAQSSMTLKEAAQRILNMRGQNVGQELENQIKQYEVDLNKMGLSVHDGAWWRALSKILNKVKNEYKSEDYIPQDQKEYEYWLDKNNVLHDH